MTDFNAGIIDEFRANNGEVGGMFEGVPLLILHTTGARTGVERLSPLMYLDYEDRRFVFASKAGADSHPAWYFNVLTNPGVSIEVGSDTITRSAVELDIEERNRIYAEVSERFDRFAKYQAGTDRVIPVIELI